MAETALKIATYLSEILVGAITAWMFITVIHKIICDEELPLEGNLEEEEKAEEEMNAN